MKKITILLLSALIAAPATTMAQKNPGQITVMSYNIRNGEAKDGTNSWSFRYPASAMMIMDQKPDVIGLQEAFDYQVDYLQEYTKGYKHVGVGREDGKKEGEHMAIFYNSDRLKLTKWGTFWLSETPEDPSMGWDAACKRTATWAIFRDKAGKKSFLVVNTHLDHVGRQAQEKGVALILEKISSINKDNLPVVLTGDFNLTPEDPVIVKLGLKMRSARETAVKSDFGVTFNNWGKSEGSAALDHIFYKGFSSCPVFEVVKKPYMERKFISDHYPVKATLIF